MDTERLLEVRRSIKSRKPEFIRQDYHKKPGLKRKWRKPKGLHSKIRLNKGGKSRKVSKGYGSPREVRGLHKSGLEGRIVANISHLDVLDNKKHGIIISSSTGKKNRIVILKKAKELGFNVLNIRNPEEYIRNAEQEIADKKKAKKDEKRDAKEKESKKEEKLSGKAEDDDKKEAEKKEKEKLLTKRER
ncbi:50S ribosomal protein L32e [Candidatus Woesearchaeota archaeon]|nr:50S ribosomal protein L32e [Candidatus Woesearchaeota archaeon]